MLRTVLATALLGYTAAFLPSASFAGVRPVSLRSGSCSLKMVDWSEPKQESNYNGAGADRGQVNKAEDVWNSVQQRTQKARETAKTGWASEYDKTGKLKEGDRDPITGRLILDPLKIPTADQGAPGSFEEYMKRRAQQSGGAVKDAFGNDISEERMKTATPVLPGTWGAPKGVDKVNIDDLYDDKSVSGFKQVDVSDVVDAEQEAWRAQREAERAEQEAAIEAKMAMWLKQAEQNKGGQ
mmetsp:Transcript_36294/g.86017  ORF Transcript_36294/g.86017 Transcript_36294/m.86017 type:complete len:239 (+) Transcript_36294:30-746(+)|eukprot:CAMPEP_0177724546 /NCGR_PEP_ID=MMETSP0484_2-20121128/18786_1 /TAXON_ID=354590 /ORGANISM="Rhodomonas lens, Strain RHODO" /LENGTH=238 /DNA_ID=CAMNT_0019237021 /DNA_START=20 /DNA_END=736 /DNA_ORIENTATION=+